MSPMRLTLCLFLFIDALAANGSYLIKFRTVDPPKHFLRSYGGELRPLSAQNRWYLWKGENVGVLKNDILVEHIQPNYPVRIPENPSLFEHALSQWVFIDEPAYPDNPEIKKPGIQAVAEDPLLSSAWGLLQVGAIEAWSKISQGKGIIVAITDTGVDYNHIDLIQNMWRNKQEIENDGIDNDQNGFVDDIVGWDFYSNDRFPYDLSMPLSEILFSGGNPGHGTHVAGVVGASLKNGRGIAGVAPKASLMALRFIGENGLGDTAGAVQSIDYAVHNGARIINASWGSEGEEAGDLALREAIERAHQAGVIFVASAGNGRLGIGYNNDTDPKPVYPASYPHENIVSVAALTVTEALSSFSNFGPKSVDVGAPGVKIMSTVPGDRFQDTIIDLGSLKVTWDGTSMASPFVTGALAVVWSQSTQLSWDQVVKVLLDKVMHASQLEGKIRTEGRLELRKIE